MLGSELRKIQPDINYPSSKEFNVTNYEQMKKYLESNGSDLIIHAAAFTSPPLVEKDPLNALVSQGRHLKCNYRGNHNIGQP